jgi:Sap, sulfolipid-1-addressing protein
LSRSFGKIHCRGELPVKLAGDVALEAAADSPGDLVVGVVISVLRWYQCGSDVPADPSRAGVDLGSLLGQLIPTAIVGALAPLPIIIVVTLLMSKGGLAKAIGFGGALVAVFAVIGIIALATSSGGSGSGSKGSAVTGTIIAVLGVLFVLLAVKQLLHAPDPDAPPKFMTALDSMSPARAAVFGMVLALINVKQLGIYRRRGDDRACGRVCCGALGGAGDLAGRDPDRRDRRDRGVCGGPGLGFPGAAAVPGLAGHA